MSLAEKRAKEKNNLKKKRRQQRFKEYKFAVPTGEGEQFSLCDAMRYVDIVLLTGQQRLVTVARES